MARAYHNLDGWMRDVRNALRDGEQRAYELAELLLELDDLIDPGVEDAEHSSGEEPESDVEIRDTPDSSSMGRPDAGHAADGSPHLVAPAGMGTALERRARQLALDGARGTREPLAPTQRLSRKPEVA